MFESNRPDGIGQHVNPRGGFISQSKVAESPSVPLPSPICGIQRSGFTIIELLVVISIIALLISLLLPALAKAKSLALRIQCASNMRQIGIAMQEYANEYRGQYPMGDSASWPFGSFGAMPNVAYDAVRYPTWGLGLLYYDSFGTQGLNIVNPRPGILSPTVQGISLIYSTQPGYFSQANFVPPSIYNNNGLVVNWGNLYSGYSYWVDYGQNQYGLNYSRSTDYWVVAGQPEYSYTHIYYNEDPAHEPALNPRSSPGSILVTDDAFFTNQFATAGAPPNPSAGSFLSNHVSENNNALPAGEHELYNDGAVIWQPMSQIKCRTQQYNEYMGW